MTETAADAEQDFYPADGTAPWSEDEENAERLLACEKRRKRYGNESCDCDHDGACAECEYDMQDVMKSRYAAALGKGSESSRSTGEA